MISLVELFVWVEVVINTAAKLCCCYCADGHKAVWLCVWYRQQDSLLTEMGLGHPVELQQRMRFYGHGHYGCGQDFPA